MPPTECLTPIGFAEGYSFYPVAIQEDDQGMFIQRQDDVVRYLPIVWGISGNREYFFDIVLLDGTCPVFTSSAETCTAQMWEGATANNCATDAGETGYLGIWRLELIGCVEGDYVLIDGAEVLRVMGACTPGQASSAPAPSGVYTRLATHVFPSQPPKPPVPPPHTPCQDEAFASMAGIVASCASTRTAAGSNCSNLYDDIFGGYNTLAERGSDRLRSFVTDDAARTTLSLRLQGLHTISHVVFFQRLLAGVGDQVSRVRIALTDHRGALAGVENVSLARAALPLEDGDVFAADAVLSRTYADVALVEVAFDEVDDNFDSGFEEVRFGHRCVDGPSPPPPPPPPPTPPPPPAPPIVAAQTAGLIAGTRVSGRMRGPAGKLGGVFMLQAPSTATECAHFCGAAGAERYVYYTGDITTLPHVHEQCACSGSGWTVSDPTATSGFVHGPPLPGPSALTAGGAAETLVSPTTTQDGLVLNVGLVPIVSSAIKLTVTFVVVGALSTGNLVRITPRRLNDCRPCLHVSNTGRIAASLEFTEKTWSKYVTTNVVPATAAIYTATVELKNRRLTLLLYAGAVATGAPLEAAVAMLQEAGDFPHSEACMVYGGKGTARTPASSVLLPNGDASVVVENTFESHMLVDVDFDTDLLTNAAKFYKTSTEPPLSHAKDVSTLAAVYDSRATLTPGYAGQAAHFDGESALVLQTPNALLPDGADVTGATLCLWLKRDAPLHTLYPTAAGIGDALALRRYAFYQDESAVVNGFNVRGSAFMSTNAQPGLSWCHFCVSAAQASFAMLYMNGSLVGKSASTQTWTSLQSSALFAIGGTAELAVVAGGHARSFKGVIDEVKLFGRQLSSAEIAAVAGV